ncbi:hypothetical protein FACS189452_03380 [Bacteroidia bacterium]|nr:hypothetical protein FACS189452_03380 [Bacteroidia bacterium]GHT80254.1 hypothetical protein FACS189467_2000 [Bacteroidia bacterium]
MLQVAAVLASNAQDIVNQGNDGNDDGNIVFDTAIVASDSFALNNPNTHKNIAEYLNGVSVKLNMVLFFTTTTHIEIEKNIGTQWSFCVPFVYAPYTMIPAWTFRVLLVQPEWRWWIQEQQEGFFVGVHAHTGYFNVAWNAQDRYQTRNGNKGKPLYGAGIGGGYATMGGAHWFLEFAIGLGYAHFEYDIFDNSKGVASGKQLGYGTRNYWGITRASVGIGYKIN